MEASSGGGTVHAKMDGRKQLLSLQIDPEAVKVGRYRNVAGSDYGGGQRSRPQSRSSHAVHRRRNAGRHGNPGPIKRERHARFDFVSCFAQVVARLQSARFQNYHINLMPKFAEPMSRLIDELKKLPGIGSKSAQRLAFHILRSSDEDAEALARAVHDVKANLRLCSICNNITDVDPCVYCSSPTRNQRLVCVVEEPTNIAAIEKTKHFNGAYHVLHGSLSPLHGVGPEQLRIGNLMRRVEGGRGRRSHYCHQSHSRRRSHRDLSLAATQTAGPESDPHRDGNSRGQRH